MNTEYRAIAIVGAGAVMPDAPNVPAFWKNLTSGRYSISEVTPDRWDPALYWDADRSAPDKTYSKIGGWVREFNWEPLKWKLAIPPKVAEAMDDAQKWGIACTREALADYGYPERPLNGDRTAVIIGNAMGGEKHYHTVLRAYFPEFARELEESGSFAALPAAVRREITREWHHRLGNRLPPITEDTMPGELGNCLAGRIANVFNFHGPNFICDAACASAMAAVSAAAEGLIEHDFDVVVTGGIDRNMGAPSFIKFSKIGALSASGTRPYADGADGFVMGEGAALFIMKRLEDAERDGDKIYAVIRGMGGSSDGKGKGITAPNPIGQKFAIERAWENAGLSPATATLFEGHGTSTSVGDVVEVESLAEVLRQHTLPNGPIALGSVKSNIGHLKSAAGAAGFLKLALALKEKVLPPSLRCEHPNSNIDFPHLPLYVNTELKPWTATVDGVRRAGLSAFGFGGTNFHAVLEEYVPHKLTGNGKRSVAVRETPPVERAPAGKAPLRGALVIGSASVSGLTGLLRSAQQAAQAGRTPALAPPSAADLKAAERIAIDYADAADLADKAGKALKALAADQAQVWKALRAQGIFRGHGPAPKVAFLYTGQGSQYVNMFQKLRAAEPIVAQTFAEADGVLTPLLGKPLSKYIFVDNGDSTAVAGAEDDLRQTAITQPAVLTSDIAMTRLLAAYGIQPDMTMGHSMGEYGALVAAGSFPFADALEAVSARGREMTRVSMADNGRMSAVFAPIPEIERILKTVEGYVVIANINSDSQAVIGGASDAVARAEAELQQAGYNVVSLSVSHAFHTSIVAPASKPLLAMLQRLHLEPPHIPVVANVTGEFYPSGPDVVPEMQNILAQQVAAPVQFVKGLHTLYDAGVRVFVEVGPKKALQGFAEDVLGKNGDVLALFTNHPKQGDLVAFNQALCGLYASGFGAGQVEVQAQPIEQKPISSTRPVVITGAAIGLPGPGHIFDDGNIARILSGEQFIDVIPTRFRRAMLDKRITRIVKSENGDGSFETITRPSDVIKLAGRGAAFDIGAEYGVGADRVAALDRATALAIAVGYDALRDAGIPLTLHYKTTSKGTRLPNRWALPDGLRDDTGIIFASVFPGYDSFADEMARYYADRARREQLEMLESLAASANGSAVSPEIARRIAELRAAVEKAPYHFDRRFIFRVLSMGHSQFAELIGARGPNTQVNAACASTTQALGVAEDWIRTGRCRRVIVVSADDVTSDHLMEWFGSAFLASGVAATDDVVEETALPFDRRRHGMIIGMGAAALMVESADAAAERGLRPICEVLSAVSANSAFHGTRLDVNHICGVMETLVRRAETAYGIERKKIAPQTVFVSHETYTPARGGSASAEVHALRKVFGDAADQIVVANTKGFTGHAMGTGIEDVVAVKALETGIVPPVANFKEVDPELGPLNLSHGGAHPVEYALRLGAGFGSQISMTLSRRIAAPGPRPSPDALGFQYRIADPAAWQAWLDRLAGHPAALEVVKRTLRVKEKEEAAAPAPAPAPAVAVAVAVEKETAPLPPPRAANGIRERVLAIVAEKTGYPLDMLALDLDLEADLGIDTVKQAEMFAAIREAYHIPRDQNLKLRDFPTLAHVIQFAEERSGIGGGPVEPGGDIQRAGQEAYPTGGVAATILEIVSEKTGYPLNMLSLELDLEADLGIDTVKQAEIFAAVREAFHIPRDQNLKLRDFPTLEHVIKFAEGRTDSPPQAGQPAPQKIAEKDRLDLGIPRDQNVKLRDFPQAGQPAPQAIAEKVLEIVAEKTGYPKDMLDLDLDLEADLGIDTVKQAEMFASVREAFHIPRDQNLKLRDFPTLAHVIKFAEGRTDSPPQAGQPYPTVPRRVPMAALRPPLELCKPTSVVLGPGCRVAIAPDQHGVAQALTDRLKALGVEVVDLQSADTIYGIYWLPALDDEGDVRDLTPERWHAAVDARLKSFYRTMRTRYGQPSFLLSATRLGGQHGYDETGATAPLGGAVTGFTKTYKRERPECLVKAVDFAGSHKPAEIADLLICETLRDTGAVEIGYQNGQRFTVGMQEVPFAEGETGMTLNRDTVFVITGAAGSIVSAITADLAAASGGTFHLLDLVPPPDPANPDLKRFAIDKEGLKRDLFARIQARGERATPALVEKELAALERAVAAQAAFEAVKTAGGTAYYYPVDLTDAAGVAAAIEQVRQRSGRIDVLLHAAGFERSHMLPDKDPREFDLVFDVKADGWFHLLHAIGDMPLAASIVFSSISGRFGNAGQTDYSSANDLLCKFTSSFRRTRSATRGIAIDWSAWAGIGMASRGSIPKMMEIAGIEMLSPEAGVPWIRRELTTGNARGEVIVGRSLGALLHEWDEAGGLEDSAVASAPMLGRAVRMDSRGSLMVETPLDPTVQPFLYDHQIEGTPVLPGVMGIEAFAEAALSIAPGWEIAAVENVRFDAPFKFYRSEPRTVTVHAVFGRAGENLLADCRLTGVRTLPNQTEPQVTTHFTGRVRLAKALPRPAGPIAVHKPAAVIEAADIYRVYFHGPAYRVLRQAWWDQDRIVGEMAEGLPPDVAPGTQEGRPGGLLRMAPRLIELCFQTAGLWEIAVLNRMGLPRSVDAVWLWAAPGSQAGQAAYPTGSLFAVVTPNREAGSFAVEVVDSAGTPYVHLEGYRTVTIREDAAALLAPQTTLA